ncbi:olfactory receptor 8D1-like [Bufo gargarizans]|uniref:olfactory receptor 8D1-like n=1 Tax=Bufo gargarizans TaxID=30331 RepID=UPI001CF26DA5|nr:olfactory receptor 8D1-like [Bufo gargarizans]
MNTANHTVLTFFIIKGISDVPKLQVPIFLLVLLIYLITVGGNMTILLLVCVDPQLHTPMYFFLCNLSILDISSSTVTLHKILISFLSGDKTVSVQSCLTQMFIFTSLVCNELLILTAMSYDRCVAICNPLRYSSIMSRVVCSALAVVCWALGFVESLPHLILISRFTCYHSKEINHFFCDIVPLVKLSCDDTSLSDFLMFICGLFLATFPFLLTFIPYIFIIRTIMRIRSSTGKHKAFYTCSSHLTVVVLLYMTLVCQYLRPASMDTLDSNKLFSLFNTAAVPMLNPLIYSLKNKDVKSALKRRWFRMIT